MRTRLCRRTSSTSVIRATTKPSSSMSEGLYPGFSTADMDDIFALTARLAAMSAVEAAVATAQAAHGLIPSSAAEAIVAACRQPVSVEVLAQGWDVGTPVLPLLDELRRRVPADAADSL